MRPIGDTGKYVNGLAFKPTDWGEEGTPIIRIQNLTDASKPMNRTTREVDAAYLVYRGDLLVSWSATLDAFIWDRDPALLNQHIFKVVPDESLVSKRYLYYGLKNAIKQMQRTEHVHGSTMKHINRGPFLAHPLRVPEATKQTEVVAEIDKQFSRLDSAVTNLERVRVSLARHRASTLRDAIEGRLVEPSAPWRTLPLSEVAEVQLGQQRAPVHAEAAVQLPYVRAANITWSGLDITDIKTMGFPNPARYQLADGDILLSEASGSAKEVGKPALWRNEIPGACYQKTLIRVRADRSRLLPEFAYYFFLHTCLSGQFARLAPGVGILHLTAERMLSWPTVVPPLADQQRVIAEVERRLSIARGVEAQVEANLKRAQSLRQAVLDKAFAVEA